METDPAGPIRDAKSYDLDLFAVRANACLIKPIKDYSSRGIMTECKLSVLKYFHPTINTNIDYMHSILYGVVKKLFEFWFEKVEKVVVGVNKSNYSLKTKMNLINEKLMRVRPSSPIIHLEPMAVSRVFVVYSLLFFNCV